MINFLWGFNLFTGLRKNFDDKNKIGNVVYGDFNTKMPHGFVEEEGTQYRMDALYFGYENYRIGIESDRYVRYPIQDRGAHDAKLEIFGVELLNTQQPGFKTLSDDVNFYFQNYSIPHNPKQPNFTLHDDTN